LLSVAIEGKFANQGLQALDAGRPVTFNVIRLREDIRQGQRIDGVTVEAWKNAGWQEIASAKSVGPRRMIRRACDRVETASAGDGRAAERVFGVLVEPQAGYHLPITSKTKLSGFIVRVGRFPGSVAGISVYSAAGR
jgi:hypothetical protein